MPNDAFDIDPEVKDLLPPLTDEEREILTAKLKAEGFRDGLILGTYPGLEKPILIDGHNRLEICDALGIECGGFVPLKFKSRAELIKWVRRNQLGRRNVTEERKAYLRGKEYQEEKQAVGGQKSKGVDHFDPPLSTAEKLGEKHNVSPATIKRDAKFAAAVDKAEEGKPGTREAILSGAARVTKSEITEPDEEPETDETDPGEEFVETVETLCRDIDQIVKRAKALKSDPHHYSIHIDSAVSQIEAARKTLWQGRPCHTCPYCKGDGCDTCRKTGRVKKTTYDAGREAVGDCA